MTVEETKAGSRSERVGQLSRAMLDVLVVGGGIVGAGVARDAAQRGLKVGLVDQHDFAFGTSSRSSRLLHGGLRYLAQGRIGLVREASIEKRVIHSIAPHLSGPLAFVFPTYRCPPWGAWALWKLRIGVRLYDLLCGGRNLGRSNAFNARGLEQYLPGIDTNRLTGGVRYYDGLTNDARLVVDTLRSATKSGVVLVNYCRLEQARPRGSSWQCVLQDQLGGKELSVDARCVVNATGPWADRVEHSSVELRLTKGVHLVVDRDRLPVPDAVVMTEGSRILFAIPWGERVILGTTDTDYEGAIEDVKTEPEDARYILEVVNGVFPEARLSEHDVVSSWAGLRPLIADRNGRPSDISRAHEIRSPEPGWLDIAGGKLTTYRLMAEQAVDRIEGQLGRGRTACRTAEVPLLESWETEGLSGIVPPDVSRRAVEHYCSNEWAVHLDDIMLRRGGWHYDRHDAKAVGEQVAGWMAELLGWNAERKEQELARYRATVGRVGRWCEGPFTRAIGGGTRSCTPA
ncbi:MAG TPA: glycerol-3-phosphate dehydrogenase/oxidase [Phycisphaerae bacterium]|nr:glycerol-3-phosphate dehydrogenase/oxidase [Phycisphaerae bacterium]HRY67563.1 glycerol-3-phosphate dehydrogenase/oxidase [Phycisphaerae bacterium]HSA24950.1 glycerol-3-phosphate dehydrogenase/oxidase [Phycisphaerae bacterium]